MTSLIASKVGQLLKSESAEFLRLSIELGIDYARDLRWLCDSSYPMLFRGETEAGQAFVELWEERRLRAVLGPASSEEDEAPTIVSAPAVDQPQILGSIAPPVERRKRGIVVKFDRRRWRHQY